MITSNNATLVITSSTATARHVSEVLKVAPSESTEIGIVDGGRSTDRRTEYSTWQSQKFAVTASDDDGSGTASVDLLLDYFADKTTELRELSDSYRLEVVWFGVADSDQGGFVVPMNMLSRLSDAGLSFVGTVWGDC
jgi:hypothetical protein